MSEWYNGLEFLEKIYWIIAIISSIFFVVIMLMTFLGGDVDDVDGDMSSDDGMGFQFFSFKNLVGFFTLFAWTGLGSIASGYSSTTTIIISIISGLAMMSMMAGLFFMMSKMANSGTLNINNAIDSIGEVYLTIGKERSKIGKIQLKIQGGLRELDALTDEENDLVTGSVIKVKEVISQELLLVEKLKK